MRKPFARKQSIQNPFPYPKSPRRTRFACLRESFTEPVSAASIGIKGGLMPSSCSGIHTDRERHAGDPHLIKDDFSERSQSGSYWIKSKV